MSTLDDIRQTFFQECDDLLEALDDGLQILSDTLDAENAIDNETVNAVFRAVHSIKGGAAAFALETLVRFAHRFETALDDVRSHRLDLTLDVLSAFLRAADQLADLVGAARDDREPPTETVAQISARLEALDMSTPAHASDVAAPLLPVPEEGMVFTAMALDLDFAPLTIALGEVTYRIHFVAQDQLFPTAAIRFISSASWQNSAIWKSRQTRRISLFSTASIPTNASSPGHFY